VINNIKPNAIIIISLIIIGDVIVLYSALLIAIIVRIIASQWMPIVIGFHIFAGVIIAILFIPIVYWLADLYPGYGLTGVERLRKRIIVTCLCFGSMILFDHLAQNGLWSRGILLIMTAISMVAIPVWDALARHLLINWCWWGEAVIVLGPEKQRRRVIATLINHPELGFIPVAECDLSATDNFIGVRRPDINTAVVTLQDGEIGVSALVDDLPYQRVVLVPDLMTAQSLWVSVRDLGTHLGLEMRHNLLIPLNQTVKRIIDIVIGTIAILVAIPIIIIFGTLLFMVSPGPIFFYQTRNGLNNRPFCMWKLRTMVPHADSMLDDLITMSEEARADWTRSVKIRNDPRIIPVLGHFMRRYSIDELPQLLNVVRGDMSLVGPRPLPSYHLELLDPLTERMRRRVRPGITGLWQVSGRSASSLTEQQHYDIYYVRNWSLWQDIYILGRTVLVVLRGNGAW